MDAAMPELHPRDANDPAGGASDAAQDETGEKRSMTFAYADPPYIGQAKRHYSDDPRCAEVDHRDLVERLSNDFPDGWALSLSSATLKQVLSYCPDDVRVMAWVKPFALFKPNVGVAYAWEPVIVRGGRKRSRKQMTIRDWVSAVCVQKGFTGAKPDAFCYWLFEVLNMQRGDTLVDMFPGSGAVSACLNVFQKQMRLPA
jgi:hypothetical protein